MDSIVIKDHLIEPERVTKLPRRLMSTLEIQNLSQEIDWKSLSGDVRLTEDFIHSFSHKLDWGIICKTRELSIEFIRNHLNCLNKHWDAISRYQTLTESEMDEFHDLINWSLVSRYQIMSESFIAAFKNDVDWNKIVKYQNVSDDFIEQARSERLYYDYDIETDDDYMD